MKKLFKHLGNHLLGLLYLLLEILLLIIGFFVFTILSILGISYTFGKHVIKRDYSVRRQLVPIVRSLNLAQDGIANAAAGELLNDALKIPEGMVRYGAWYETISAITGLIFLYIKDTWLRRFLDKTFSVFENDHCTNAITEMQDFYYQHKIKMPE